MWMETGGAQGQVTCFYISQTYHFWCSYIPSLKIQTSICKISLQPKAFVSCNEGSLVTNDHSFPLSEHVFILLSLLKEIFTGFRILGLHDGDDGGLFLLEF